MVFVDDCLVVLLSRHPSNSNDSNDTLKRQYASDFANDTSIIADCASHPVVTGTIDVLTANTGEIMSMALKDKFTFRAWDYNSEYCAVSLHVKPDSTLSMYP